MGVDFDMDTHTISHGEQNVTMLFEVRGRGHNDAPIGCHANINISKC